METEQTESPLYDVVINGEEQYALWPAERDVPAGWKRTGRRGPREECLAYVAEVWTDMRPRSVRQDPP